MQEIAKALTIFAAEENSSATGQIKDYYLVLIANQTTFQHYHTKPEEIGPSFEEE